MKWYPLFLVCILSLSGCYTFKDVSIQPPEAKTARVNYIENKAPYINPQLGPQLTDKVRQKINNQTRLTLVQGDDAHYEITCEIRGYNVSTSGISEQQAATNRLLVTIHINFQNRLDEKLNFEADISRNFDFDANLSLQQAEALKGDEILRNMTDEIFNRIFFQLVNLFMDNNIRNIVQHFFGKGSLQEVPETELKEFINRYPYSSVGHYLLALKSHQEYPGSVTEDLKTAALYINNPLWLQWLLNDNNGAPKNEYELARQAAPGTEPVEEKEPIPRPESPSGIDPQETPIIPEIAPQAPGALQPVEEQAAGSETDQAEEESPMPFQSYHTIDYFASQGIKLQQSELSRDKLGQQVKSFTEWLRSMKKLAPIEMANGTQDIGDDELRQESVARIAEHSIQEKEVLTESMAEVWAKQGNVEKARAIYQKLSLLNPHKNAYFVTKINQLKIL